VASRPSDLPNFDRPPIDEVAITVQLVEPIPGFTDAHVGLYWQSIKTDYPRAEPQMRLEPFIETLEEAAPVTRTLQIPLGPVGGRTWLISQDDIYIIQVQNNRFIRNWRRRTEPYPHFEPLVEGFWEALNGFRAVLHDEDLHLPPVQQVEVTYINWVPDMGIAEFLNVARSAEIDVGGVDRLPIDQTWASRYSVRAADGGMYARLHAQCNPAIRPPSGEQLQPEYGTQFAFTFVAPALGNMDDAAVDERFMRARDVIVRAFTALTTERAHDVWGRFQ
jgi:uncharacterized protein (TIGR04255 family)